MHLILIRINSDLTYRTQNPLMQLKEEYESLRKLNTREFKIDVVTPTSKYHDLLLKNPDLVPPNSFWLAPWNDFALKIQSIDYAEVYYRSSGEMLGRLAA